MRACSFVYFLCCTSCIAFEFWSCYSWKSLHVWLTLWHQGITLVDVQCDAEKTEQQLKCLVMNVQSNGQPFKSQFPCRVHWVLNFSTKGLVLDMWKIQDLAMIFSGWGCWSGTERSKLDNIPCSATIDTTGRPWQSAREVAPYLGTYLHVSWPCSSVKCSLYLERSLVCRWQICYL